MRSRIPVLVAVLGAGVPLIVECRALRSSEARRYDDVTSSLQTKIFVPQFFAASSSSTSTTTGEATTPAPSPHSLVLPLTPSSFSTSAAIRTDMPTITIRWKNSTTVVKESSEDLAAFIILGERGGVPTPNPLPWPSSPSSGGSTSSRTGGYTDDKVTDTGWNTTSVGIFVACAILMMVGMSMLCGSAPKDDDINEGTDTIVNTLQPSLDDDDKDKEITVQRRSSSSLEYVCSPPRGDRSIDVYEAEYLETRDSYLDAFQFARGDCESIPSPLRVLATVVEEEVEEEEEVADFDDDMSEITI